MRHGRFGALAGAALVVVLGASGCAGQPLTRATQAARVTVGDETISTRAPTCGQQEMYRSIDIRDIGSRIQAVVLIKGDTAIPQWVKLRDVNGFTGSFWKGGVGDAHAIFAQRRFTITGSAYGINSSNNPNRVTTTTFAIIADC